MGMKNKILAINPGSTTTKIAVFEEEEKLFSRNIEHNEEELAKFDDIFDQYQFRRDLILKVLAEQNIDPASLNAVVARGGLLPPVASGAYLVNEEMIEQLHYYPQNEVRHASNLGAPIAKSISDSIGVPAYIYDPVTVDEMEELAKVTGIPEMRRSALGHNLNMRAMAHHYARLIDIPYNKLTLIVAHLGGGITLALHQNGRIADMVSDEEGPFSPERSGGLPLFQTIAMAFSGDYDSVSMMKKVKNSSGLYAHLGTKDAREIEKRIAEGDEHAALIYEAMALAIAKAIGQLAVYAKGKVDGIILTGGIAYSTMINDWIKERVSFIAPVTVLAGEDEMQSLASGALRVLLGKEKAREFKLQIPPGAKK